MISKRTLVVALLTVVATLMALVVLGASPKPRGRYGVRDLWWRTDYTRTIYGDDAIADATVAVHGLRPVDVRAFGAYPGDNVADADSLEAAWNTYDAVLIPPGDYTITRTMVISNSGVHVRAHGAVFTCATDVDSVILQIGTGTDGLSHVVWEGGEFRFAGDALDWDGTTGIKLNRASRCRVRDFAIYRTEKGVALFAPDGYGCVHNAVEPLIIYDCKWDLHLSQAGAGWVNDNEFRDGHLYYSTALAAVDIHDAAAIYMGRAAGASEVLDRNAFINLSLEYAPDDGGTAGFIPDAVTAASAINAQFFGLRIEGFDGPANNLAFMNLGTSCEGMHIEGGTILDKSDFVSAAVATTLASQRTHRMSGSGTGYAGGGPILELVGRGGYDTGYPIMSVLRADGGDTSLAVTRYALRAPGVWAGTSLIKNGVHRGVRQISAADTLLSTDDLVVVSSISGTTLVDLAARSGLTIGKQFTVVNADDTPDTVRVRGLGLTEAINGNTGHGWNLGARWAYITVTYVLDGVNCWAITGGNATY